VRDLLRAIRNKKHHYRELTEEAKALYGEMPGEFAEYWTSRFPRLVMHSYKAMQCCKMEPNFEKYYYKDFDFVPQFSLTVTGSAVMAREQGDIHPSDVDLLSPGFLDPPCPAAQAPSPHSVVSTWSQLSQGSRLSADSSYRDDLLLPCSRDPSSEEGSDTKDSSEEELESVNECKDLRKDTVVPDNDFGEKGVEDEELPRNCEGSKDDKNEALAEVEAHTLLANVAEEVESGRGENPCDNDEQIHGVAIKCVTANDKEVESQTPVETTELTQTAPLLDIKDLDTVIEDLIPKKKNKKRRKHAKKKKPGAVDQDEDNDDEEDIPVEA